VRRDHCAGAAREESQTLMHGASRSRLSARLPTLPPIFSAGTAPTAPV